MPSDTEVASTIAELRQRVHELRAELEQAKRERDELLHYEDRALTAEARLAKVPALVEALRLIGDPTDERNHERHPSKIARDALAVWERV